MSHRSFRVVVVCLATLVSATRVKAQFVMVRGSGAYSAVGFGAGNIKLTCDSGCSGNQVHSNDFGILFGYQFGSRLRAETGVHFQRHSDPNVDLTLVSGGLSAYLVGNLYVRGAATYVTSMSVADPGATFDGKGGPGFSVGAGYELFLGLRTALTPYVNYTSTSLTKIDRTVTGAATVTTAGTVRALNFGVSIGRSPRHRIGCLLPGGGILLLTRQNVELFRACLDAERARMGLHR